ncbi:restriction endonuclease subunit S [Empedobacter falsenii]
MTEIQKDNKNIANVPHLRFPGFTGEWEVKKLGEIAEKIGDGLHGTPIYVEESDFYFINGNNLVNGKIEINENTKKIDVETFIKNDKQLRKNTLLISINGTIGNIAKYDNENVMLGKSVGYFNFEENSDFIYFVLQTKLIQNFFNSELTGSTIKNLSLKTLRETLISRPNQVERQQISSFLSLIDERIQTQIKIIEQLKTLIKGLYQKLILTQTPNVKLKDCVSCHSSSLAEAEILNERGIYPIFGATGIISYSENYQIDEDAIMIIKDGSGVGKVQYGTGRFSVIGTLNYLTVKSDVNLKYIFFCLKFFNFNKYKVGSGIPHIYFKDYGEALIYCPSLDEQNKIEKLLSSIDEKINLENTLLQKLKYQKKHLLQNLFI